MVIFQQLVIALSIHRKGGYNRSLKIKKMKSKKPKKLANKKVEHTPKKSADKKKKGIIKKPKHSRGFLGDVPNSSDYMIP